MVFSIIQKFFCNWETTFSVSIIRFLRFSSGWDLEISIYIVFFQILSIRFLFGTANVLLPTRFFILLSLISLSAVSSFRILIFSFLYQLSVGVIVWSFLFPLFLLFCCFRANVTVKYQI